MSKTTVSLRFLERLVYDALLNLGIEEVEAKVVTDVLMYAEKRGSSQGLIKIIERTILPDDNCTPVAVNQNTPAIISIDGGGHTGMYVLHRAVEAAREAVNHCGITLVTTRNTRSSTGSIGCYARKLADSGYIAIVLAGSPKVVAVEGGIDPVLGTNPIAISIPTDGNSIVFDSATAAITWFSVLHARNNGERLPDKVAIDSTGSPTCDPAAAINGALLTMAGAKGSGLALMFEFLTASLAGASIVGCTNDNRGNTIICFDPTQVTGDSDFYTNASKLVQRIKASRSKDINIPMRLPGEASEARAVECENSDSIEVNSAILAELKQLAG